MTPVAVPAVRLCKIDVGSKANTFQLLCTKFFSSSSDCDLTVIYRTGSILQRLFTDLCNLLDCGTIYVDPVYMVGDVNIRIHRPADTSTRQFTKLLTAHGLVCYATTLTHDDGLFDHGRRRFSGCVTTTQLY